MTCLNCSCPRVDHPGDGYCINCRCDGFESGEEAIEPVPVVATPVVSLPPRVIGIKSEPALAVPKTPTLHDHLLYSIGETDAPYEIPVPSIVTSSIDRKLANSLTSQPPPTQPIRWRIRSINAEESEINFVVQTWLRSYKKHSHFLKDVPDGRFFLHRDLVVKSILVRAQVRVATLSESDMTILGWVCWEQLPDETLLHYVYVKDAFRKSGVGRDLVSTVPHGKIVVTHRTSDANVYLERHQWKLTSPNRSPTRIIYDPDMVVQWSAPNA